MRIDPDDPWFERALGIEAEALARHHGLEPDRVIQIFGALAEVEWLSPNFPWNTALDVAAAYLGLERALRLFEEEDLLQLGRRAALLDYLFESQSAPFCTLDELANYLHSAAGHQASNEESWLATGFPTRLPPAPAWLLPALACVLPVKQPVLTASPYSELSPFDVRPLCYAWTSAPAEPSVEIAIGEGRLLMSSVPTFEPTQHDLVPYEDAPTIPGIDEARAQRLVALRSTVLAARRDVLNALSEAVRRGDSEALWPLLLAQMTHHFTFSDVDFLLTFEAHMRKWDPGAGQAYEHQLRPFVLDRGGVGDLFMLGGICEEALTTGRYCHLATEVGRLFGDRQISSYYEVIDSAEREQLDEALDRFLALEEEESDYWDGFMARVNWALAQEFSDYVTVTVKVKRPYVEHFEPMVRTFAEWQKEHLEHGGPPLAIAGPSQMVGTERRSAAGAFPPPLHLSCERDGERHEVLVDGLPVLLTDQQLALLLRLIHARLEDGDGWLDIERADGGGLIAEGFLSDADRAINRFRSEFKTACRPNDPKQLFPRAQGKLRLATAPEFVTWNPDALLAIDNAIVAKEALAIIATT